MTVEEKGLKPTKAKGGENKKMKTGARNQGAATAQITRRDRAGNVKVPAASRREGPRDCATKRGKKFPSSDNGCHVRPLGLRRKAVLTIIWEKKDIASFATPQCRLRVGNDDVRSDKLRTLQVARRTKLGLSSLIERTPHCCMATRVSVCTISSTRSTPSWPKAPSPHR
jgi:hypothetical protein